MGAAASLSSLVMTPLGVPSSVVVVVVEVDVVLKVVRNGRTGAVSLAFIVVVAKEVVDVVVVVAVVVVVVDRDCLGVTPPFPDPPSVTGLTKSSRSSWGNLSMDIGEKFDKSTFLMSNCNSTGGGVLFLNFSCSFLAWPISFCMKSMSCCWSDILLSVLVLAVLASVGVLVVRGVT